MDGFVEKGSKNVFASAMDWPGWSRGAKTEQEAIEALLAYGDRYKKVVKDFKPPKSLKVVERLKGGSGTDFGIPSLPPKADARPLTQKELDRQVGILEASWKAFDAAAKKYARTKLATGPRGGGRDVKKMVDHVHDADRAYLSDLGGKYTGDDVVELRKVFVRTLKERAGGWEPKKGPRRQKPFWTPRYAIRRSAWHALDHAWEIEDRAT